jgi:hypothetical protein
VYRWPLEKRREVLDAVASGMPMLRAFVVFGVSFATVREWWVQAAGMGLLNGRIATSLPGGEQRITDLAARTVALAAPVTEAEA